MCRAHNTEYARTTGKVQIFLSRAIDTPPGENQVKKVTVLHTFHLNDKKVGTVVMSRKKIPNREVFQQLEEILFGGIIEAIDLSQLRKGITITVYCSEVSSVPTFFVKNVVTF